MRNTSCYTHDETRGLRQGLSVQASIPYHTTNKHFAACLRKEIVLQGLGKCYSVLLWKVIIGERLLLLTVIKEDMRIGKWAKSY